MNLKKSFPALAIIALVISAFLISSCKDESHDDQNVNTALTTEDSIATAGMLDALEMMHHAHDSMVNASHHPDQLHFDSVYHHYDSLFWHHHNDYHHDTYSHDDHHHTWTPYDSTAHHNNHHHHSYPGHSGDSLVVTASHHMHDNSDHHHPGHDINQHHELDSLHHQHILHHP